MDINMEGFDFSNPGRKRKSCTLCGSIELGNILYTLITLYIKTLLYKKVKWYKVICIFFTGNFKKTKQQLYTIIDET